MVFTTNEHVEIKNNMISGLSSDWNFIVDSHRSKAYLKTWVFKIHSTINFFVGIANNKIFQNLKGASSWPSKSKELNYYGQYYDGYKQDGFEKQTRFGRRVEVGDIISITFNRIKCELSLKIEDEDYGVMDENLFEDEYFGIVALCSESIEFIEYLEEHESKIIELLQKKKMLDLKFQFI